MPCKHKGHRLDLVRRLVTISYLAVATPLKQYRHAAVKVYRPADPMLFVVIEEQGTACRA